LKSKQTVLAILATLGLVLAAQSTLAAEALDSNFQRVRSLDDPTVADIEDILVESGSVFLSYASPYSDQELRDALDRIDPEKLSEAGRDKYNRARDALRPAPKYSSGELGLKVGLEANLDGNWRSDESVPWVLGYQERPSFLSLPVEAWASDSVYGYFDPAWQRDYYSVNLPVSELSVPNYTSVPIDLIGSDVSFPFRSFGAVGGDFWRLSLGRDRISIGSMGEDNLFVNSETEWYDYARLTLFFRDLQYSAYIVQLDTDRYLYMHHLDLLLFDRLSFAITEGLLVGYDSPQLRYFNPFMIFHGYIAWNDETYPADATTGDGTAKAANPSGVGSMFGLELNYNLARYVTLTAQFQFNAGQDPLKMLLWPDTTSEIPNSDAILVGAKLRMPLDRGYLKGFLCGVYAEPYDMVLGTDQISYIYRRQSNSSYSGDSIEEWIGFSEGPDCIFVSGSLGYEFQDRASLDFSASYRWKGENDLGTVYAWSTENASKEAPTGTVEGRLRLGIKASYPLAPSVSAEGAAYYTHRSNADHILGSDDQSVELMLGLGLKL
jgi:hypothetical protein